MCKCKLHKENANTCKNYLCYLLNQQYSKLHLDCKNLLKICFPIALGRTTSHLLRLWHTIFLNWLLQHRFRDDYYRIFANIHTSTYTLRNFPIGVGRDNSLPLAMILTNICRLHQYVAMPSYMLVDCGWSWPTFRT